MYYNKSAPTLADSLVIGVLDDKLELFRARPRMRLAAVCLGNSVAVASLTKTKVTAPHWTLKAHPHNPVVARVALIADSLNWGPIVL